MWSLYLFLARLLITLCFFYFKRKWKLEMSNGRQKFSKKANWRFWVKDGCRQKPFQDLEKDILKFSIWRKIKKLVDPEYLADQSSHLFMSIVGPILRGSHLSRKQISFSLNSHLLLWHWRRLCSRSRIWKKTGDSFGKFPWCGCIDCLI